MAGRYQKGFDMSVFDSLKCFLGSHDFERVGPVVPIKKENDWVKYYMGHFAMGKCRRCPKLQMRNHRRPGESRSWKRYEERTFEEYIKEHEGDSGW